MESNVVPTGSPDKWKHNAPGMKRASTPGFDVEGNNTKTEGG